MKAFLLAMMIPTIVLAQSLNEEVTKTTQLRQEVELLAHEVETLKKAQQSEMDVYLQRYQEVSGNVLKEKFRQDQLKSQIKLGSSKLEAHSKKLLNKGSKNWLERFWKKYEESLAMAHPLYSGRLQERINKLKVDLEFNKISYEHALLQTWFVLETDLNKSQDVEFILSPMQINEELYHVEMARLGRNKGYFRTSEGKYGLLFYNKKWEMTFFEDSKSKNSIEVLLTQFKKQEKSGLHNLPGIKL